MKFVILTVCAFLIVSTFAEDKTLKPTKKDIKGKRESPSSYSLSGLGNHGSLGSFGGAFSNPSMSYGTPSFLYGVPSSSYGVPSASYGVPSSSAYNFPSISYGMPSGSYGVPFQTYGMPLGSHNYNFGGLSGKPLGNDFKLFTPNSVGSLDGFFGGHQSQIASLQQQSNYNEHNGNLPVQQGQTNYGFTTNQNGGHGLVGASIGFGSDYSTQLQGLKSGHSIFSQGQISQPISSYGVPSFAYQMPSGAYGTPVSSALLGSNLYGEHSIGVSSRNNLGSSLAQDQTPVYAAGVKGLGHYSTAIPIGSGLSSSSFGSSYSSPQYTSGKSLGYNFQQKPSAQSLLHTSVPTYASSNTDYSSSSSKSPFRPSAFLGAFQESSSDYKFPQQSYGLPLKSYLPPQTSYGVPSSTYGVTENDGSSHGSFPASAAYRSPSSYNTIDYSAHH